MKGFRCISAGFEKLTRLVEPYPLRIVVGVVKMRSMLRFAIEPARGSLA
jgi:hypothetical protein